MLMEILIKYFIIFFWFMLYLSWGALRAEAGSIKCPPGESSGGRHFQTQVYKVDSVVQGLRSFQEQSCESKSLSDLAPHEERILLKGMDSLCADVWCEGSFDFEFHTFKCLFKKGECLLGFDYVSVYREGIGLVRGAFPVFCLIQADSRAQLFGNKDSFWLSAYLSSQVDECVRINSLKAWEYYEKKGRFCK